MRDEWSTAKNSGGNDDVRIIHFSETEKGTLSWVPFEFERCPLFLIV